MPDGIRWVGLDVHARESTLAVFDQATGEVVTRRVVGRPHELLPALRQIPRPARMVYEAGPTGYGLARRARAEGIEVAVCAPGKTDRPASDRVKTDKRDAIRLARLLAAGELVLVTIPSIEREQLRDLVRCREDIRADLMRARHRIGKFLLRREIYYEGPAVAWTLKYRSWLTSVRFADQASRATWPTISTRRCADRPPCPGRGRAAQLALTAPCAPTIARLRCLRGIDTLTAFGLCAEIGEWERFDHPDQPAAYLGTSPSTPPARTPVGVDHQGGLHARAAAAGRGLLALPARARRRTGARAPPARTRARDHQHLLESATPAERPLAPAQRRPPQARRDRCGRRRARARGVLLDTATLTRPDPVPPASLPAGDPPTQAAPLPPKQKTTTRRRLTNSR